MKRSTIYMWLVIVLAGGSIIGGAALSMNKTVQIVDGVFPSAANPETGGWSRLTQPATGPKLVIWEDPQCPHCADFEKKFGVLLAQAAFEGKLQLEFRMISFLDKNLPESNNSSQRAINAIGCAFDQDRMMGPRLHDILYMSQPAVEGQGWNNQELMSFGSAIGLSKEQQTQYETCIKAGTYASWADHMTSVFQSSGHKGTPTLELDNKQLDLAALYSLTTDEQRLDFLTGKTTVYTK